MITTATQEVVTTLASTAMQVTALASPGPQGPPGTAASNLDQINSGIAILVSGADPASLDGTYAPNGAHDGRGAYIGVAVVMNALTWSAADARWELSDVDGVRYVSLDDVDSPDLATTWGSVGLDAPLVCLNALFPELSGTYIYDPDYSTYYQGVGQSSGRIAFNQNADPYIGWWWQSVAGISIAYSQSAVTPSAWVSVLLAVSGAGESAANEYFYVSGVENNKPKYSAALDNGFVLLWDTNFPAWVIRYDGSVLYPQGTVLYYSTDDVTTPDLCIQWNAVDGPLPLPAVALVDQDFSVIVAPVAAPDLLVSATDVPAGMPVVTDGAGALTLAAPSLPGYPIRLTAQEGWETAAGLAAGLVSAMGIELAPSDGEAPGAALMFHLCVLPHQWARLVAYMDFGSMVAIWPWGSASINPGDTVIVHAVNVS